MISTTDLTVKVCVPFPPRSDKTRLLLQWNIHPPKRRHPSSEQLATACVAYVSDHLDTSVKVQLATSDTQKTLPLLSAFYFLVSEASEYLVTIFDDLISCSP